MKTKGTQLSLLTVPAMAPSASVRLTALKRAHGILTHRSRCVDERPWTALLPAPEDKGKDLFGIMAESAGMYEGSNRCVFADGELSAVRELCQLNGIACDL